MVQDGRWETIEGVMASEWDKDVCYWIGIWTGY